PCSGRGQIYESVSIARTKTVFLTIVAAENIDLWTIEREIEHGQWYRETNLRVGGAHKEPDLFSGLSELIFFCGRMWTRKGSCGLLRGLAAERSKCSRRVWRRCRRRMSMNDRRMSTTLVHSFLKG